MLNYPPENLLSLRLSHTLLELHFSSEVSEDARIAITRLMTDSNRFVASTKRDIHIVFLLRDIERLAHQIEHALEMRREAPIEDGMFVSVHYDITVHPELLDVDGRRRVQFFLTLFAWDADASDRIAFGVRDVAEVSDVLPFVAALKRLSVAN